MNCATGQDLHEDGLDNSCQTWIRNPSNQPLMLECCHLDTGKWPLRQPTNVIEAGEKGAVHLGSLCKLVRYTYTSVLTLKTLPYQGSQARIKYEI